MAKTLANYDPLVQIPSGMTPAGADFPIVESHDILVGENDKRLDAKLDDIDSAIGNVGQTPIATQLSSKVNTGDIQTTVRDASSASDSKIPSEKAVRSAIDSKTINVDSTVTQGSTNAVSGGAVYTQLATKQDTLTFDTTPTASSSNPVTSGGVKTALDTKQDALTFDTTPTASSSNPVTSGGVKAALDNKQNTLTYETTPIVGSVNPVTSTGIRNAIDTAAAQNLGAMQAAYDTFSANISARVSSLSNGMVACSNIAAETTVGDTRILLYTGTTNANYTNGHWYYNSAPSNAAPSWTDGGAVGSAPTIDNTLTVEGAAANSKAVGDAIENIVTISNTQPGSNSGNKVWIRETTNEEVQVPTYAEHIAKANKADIATNNESDNGSGTISASKAYAIGDHFYINNTNTSSENYGVSTLYKATAAIASGDAIVVGTNCEASKVADEITSLSNDIDTVKADLDDYFVGDEHVSVTWEAGSIDNEGQDIDSNTTVRCDYINVVENPITKIKTSESVYVALFWYDANKTYLSKGSVTINGTYELVLSTNASYVRFAAVTNNPHNVKIVKDAQAVVVNKKATVIAEAHNQIANGLFVFVCPLQRGILDYLTGIEVVNNSYVRTDYINIFDYKIIGYYAPVNPGLNVIEYASDKTFIKRTLYSTTGIVNINFNEATVYVRYTWVGARTLKILQSVPFMMATEKQQIIDSSKIEIANIKNLSEKCVHHDNFSRTMTGYAIGKNSEGTLTDNSYDTVTGTSSDDGVRVDNGLTIGADNSRTSAFTVRKVNAVHSANFVVEFNAPESGQGVYIIYRLADSMNFEAINVTYNGTYYGFIKRTVVNGAFGSTIDHKNVYNSLGYVIKLYFLSGIIAVYIDDKFCYSFYASNIDDNLYIGAYRAVTAHFDFINIFDLVPPLVWSTEYLTDDGISVLPNSTLSANENRYALDDSVTRFSNKSEHFMLYSTDEKINNGRRTERSLVALIPENLRTMRYEFDVLFPASILPDTATGSYGDIFFQLHDRQSGVSRGHVPFHLSLVGNEIHFSQYYSSEQASNTLTEVVSSLNLGEVIYDKWMHFEIFIKERYEENQHPFIEIKIDGVTVYQSRKPNCTNDVKGTSAQYGEYKNNWELITYSERYIDNLKVTY